MYPYPVTLARQSSCAPSVKQHHTWVMAAEINGDSGQPWGSPLRGLLQVVPNAPSSGKQSLPMCTRKVKQPNQFRRCAQVLQKLAT